MTCGHIHVHDPWYPQAQAKYEVQSTAMLMGLTRYMLLKIKRLSDVYKIRSKGISPVINMDIKM